ncbi:hypothetical protein KIN20_004019 [Parelaphostrongylus tenuis]|uniref:Elongator complex protein 2 n=1 Tax=Parelaphostrongylus tenuis TaxID=148309 RepID=A0AAD5MGL9_PARTN|nr:hypothetical protein KIN20_004019 [Parelaphostrongylus tenuis]
MAFVKLWRIEEEEVKGGGDGEICVTKNRFQIESPEKTLSLSLSVEAVLAGHDDWVHSTQWNSEGCSLLTSSSDKTVIVWKEACDGRLWTDAVRIGIVGGQAAGFFGAIFSPSTRQIVAYSYHGGLYGWVFSEKDNMWNAVAMCSGHTGEVRDVAWHPDGKFFISVGEDKTTRIYIPQKDQKFVEVARPQVHGHSMQCLAVVSSSTFVSGAEEKIFRVFEAPQTFAKSLCNISGFQMTEVFGKSTFPHFGAKVSALGLSNKAIEDSQESASLLTIQRLTGKKLRLRQCLLNFMLPRRRIAYNKIRFGRRCRNCMDMVMKSML